ncbi:MAG: ImmA/IrrE family metallo-endopeptidase [Candidatus Zixiibacteriota bacterium]|jgi:Zn-dependent peptidase ImmA (M78 family)
MHKAGRHVDTADVFAAVEHLGLDVVYWEPEEEGLAGALVRSARTIFVNASLPAARMRYTVAHELGHYLLGHGDACCPCPSRAEEELEADCFAAALLMPPALLHSMWVTLGDLSPAPKVTTIARRLGVPRQALGYRLVTLGFPENGRVGGRRRTYRA